MSTVDILGLAAKSRKEGTAFVLATIVEGESGSPGRTGFKVLVFADGNFAGTVGGGKMEQIILEKCADIHKTHDNVFDVMELNEAGIGMACGGSAKVYYEYHPADRRVFLFGAGHTCKSLSPLLRSIGFKVVVVDNRADFAQAELLPNADEVYYSDYLKFVSEMSINDSDAAIIFTHGHLHDEEVLEAICQRNLNFNYLGMIGSKVKVKQINDRIIAKSYQGNQIEKMYSPIGLNVATRSTEEISIAIAAEILAVYNNVDEIKFLSRRT